MLPQLTVPVVTVISPLQVLDARTPDQQWFDGFNQYADCMRDGDWLDVGELAVMTPQERKGYNDAISAADYAEWSEYMVNTNSFCDLTEY
jgi:hypothetical protein